jgi:hypothetical protein
MLSNSELQNPAERISPALKKMLKNQPSAEKMAANFNSV